MENTPITYRKAERKDAKRIADLAESIWTEYYSELIGPQQVRYMLENFQSENVIRWQIEKQGYVYFLAEENGVPIAYSAFLWETDGSLFLSKIYIEKSHRRKGYAKAMLDFALSAFETPQNLSLWLTVNKRNEASIAAYQKLGFIIVDSLETDIGNGFVMDDYKMQKQY